MFVFTLEDIGCLIIIGLVALLIIARILVAMFQGIGERILRRGMKEEDEEVDECAKEGRNARSEEC